MKANPSVGENLLVCDGEVVQSWSVTLFKDKGEFLFYFIWEFLLFEKNLLQSLLLMPHGTPGTSHTVKWPWQLLC